MNKNIENLVNNSRHFCILPWIHFHAWPDKRVLPCCVADSNMPVSNIKSNESIIEMLNSENYKKIRKNMLNDEPSPECKRCYDLELLGTWTLRQSHNKNTDQDSINLVADTNEDGSLNQFKMKYMDIRFSNICNMKCRSCGPSCSSQWAQEFIEHKGIDVLNHYFGISKMVVNNNEDQQFLLKLKPYLKDVKEVYFAGGEIIITPEHYECLDYWIENNLTDQVELTYTTNFSVLKYKNRDLFQLWKKFPKLKIWASLDAGGDHAEIMRKGTKWQDIEENIRKLHDEVPHADFQITPTISIWNIFNFPEFFDSLVEKKMSNFVNPRFNLLTSPWYANIMILPYHIRMKLKEKYIELRNKYSDNTHLVNAFNMIIYTLEQGKGNRGGILEFIKFNNDLDILRKEKLTDIIPDLKEVYEWAAN